MCTFILLHRPGHDWPLLAAANRDEMLARPWLPPARHWPDQPDVLGGKDVLAGGTWLAANDAGVLAAVLNRTGSLGPAAGKRSRGDLPLMALRHTSARGAADAITAVNAAEWRSFNLVIADPAHAYCLRGLGEGQPDLIPLPPGVSMITSADPNDTRHPRTARHLPRFQEASPPEPPDWGAWPGLLADADGPWEAALNVPARGGFGTASSTLAAIATGRRLLLFAGGPPGTAPFEPVAG